MSFISVGPFKVELPEFTRENFKKHATKQNILIATTGVAALTLLGSNSYGLNVLNLTARIAAFGITLAANLFCKYFFSSSVPSLIGTAQNLTGIISIASTAGPIAGPLVASATSAALTSAPVALALAAAPVAFISLGINPAQDLRDQGLSESKTAMVMNPGTSSGQTDWLDDVETDQAGWWDGLFFSTCNDDDALVF